VVVVHRTKKSQPAEFSFIGRRDFINGVARE